MGAGCLLLTSMQVSELKVFGMLLTKILAKKKGLNSPLFSYQ